MELTCVEGWMSGEMVCIKAKANTTYSKSHSFEKLFIGFYVDSIGGERCDLCIRFAEDMNVLEDSYVQLLRFDDKVVAGTFYIKFREGEVWHDGRFDVSWDN